MLENRRWILALVAVAALALAGWWFLGRADGSVGSVQIETAATTTGEVRSIVAASGAVRALVTVEVGSQLSGQLAEVLVDFNDEVEEGQVIARLDPQTYETRVREAEASRATALASLALQRATLTRVRANTGTAQLNFDRTETLSERGNASAAALDNARAALDAALADVSVAQAQIANAEAVLRQRDATLEGALIDLERTTIRSPINGIVVDRAVDEGQTVAASLSAPVLFTIAQDLRQVQIDAQVDEADIGQIAEGQPVSFTVDAYPDMQLTGLVDQIRLSPTALNNVVTYTVVVTAANPGQRLLPGMTANMDIVTGERDGVLRVSNSALRFRPSPVLEGRTRPVEAAPAGGPRRGGEGGGRRNPVDRLTEQLDLTPDQAESAGTVFRSAFGRAQGAAQAGGGIDRDALQAEIDRGLQAVLTPEQMQRYRAMAREAANTRSATVWVQEADGMLVERRVRLGISDSQNTEVVAGDLAEGDLAVTRAREVRE
ncbi:HlyD family secretion protein [Maricaulis salignorans]|uniref:HlyD family secretion protein n=1 Tax=Maricaulis salignorans TaxID=144026 RepID=A0A1G9W8M1_9PROT|nr:HlyD family secretion protein [Maricaulis salignorans]